ncbi:hypothetical protein BST95_01180 [Halioglobus japonicus]|uniref:Uncharacterized protein n=1 Tax=Halioglobus japonicus TaxID=930805 RepID=A0AAP8MBZ1_9GAMM|nr:hypothetical protein [Halioglobus japonicus]AQA17029.1 hypothetical protein BST95_01180 [Halioglobus japonicus]PLW84936.1 hypothetical protein C0029_15445 [Halioglobus japonicus]GHD18614.1 hypothetical protein GCM10007052_26140 [Halioglobus japonicus]
MSEQTSAPSGLYAFAECEVVDMQNGAVMLIDRHGDGQLMVAPTVAQAMQMCREFRTLDHHARVLTNAIPELKGQQADVMNVFGMLQSAGLLVSAESVCERLNAPVPPAVDLPATRAFIITCDRPAAVKRLLESMLHAGNLTRHEALFLIDDSRDPENARLNREAMEDFNITCPKEIQYIGAAEAKALMNGLIAALPQHEAAIRFLVDREQWAADKTYGLARNLCLLLSMDRRAIVMDDDIICAAINAPHTRPGLHFGHTPREVDIYTDQQEMLGRTQRADFDPLSGHAQCLGLTMGQAITKLNGKAITPADLEGANAAYVSLWSAESPVLVTQSGTMGDPGTPGTEWLLTLDPASTKRLQQFNGGIAGALASRHYWLGQPQPLFTKLSVISQMTGLDNSQLLPPYFPAHRGEDYLFGAMTEYLHPHAAVLDYAWAVPHLPLEPRPGNPEPAPITGKGKASVNKYITDRTRYEPGVSAQTRLASLATMAAELGEADDRSLTTIYRKEVAENQGAELSRLSRHLQDGTIREPSWQDWLQRSANSVATQMQQPAALGDFKDLAIAPEQLLPRFKGYCSSFAQALNAWSDIRQEAAKQADQWVSAP